MPERAREDDWEARKEKLPEMTTPENRMGPLNNPDEPRNPLDLPPIEMTDDEWREWCAILGIEESDLR